MEEGNRKNDEREIREFPKEEFLGFGMYESALRLRVLFLLGLTLFL